MSRTSDRRTRGSVASVLLLVLVVVVAGLGLNYVRNYRSEQQDEKIERPYAGYNSAALDVLAEGYRVELVAAEKRYAGRRVETRKRHHFGDQVREFERVQRETRKERDRALDLAQIRRDFDAIEAEQRQRAAGGDGLAAHLERLFAL